MTTYTFRKIFVLFSASTFSVFSQNNSEGTPPPFLAGEPPSEVKKAAADNDNKFLTLELLSGTEDGFGLGIKYDPNIGDDATFSVSANLFDNPSETNLDFVKASFRYSLKDWHFWESNDWERNRDGSVRIFEYGEPFNVKLPWRTLKRDSIDIGISADYASTQDFDNLEYSLGAGFTWHSLRLRDVKYSPIKLIDNVFEALGASSSVIENAKAPIIGIEYELVKSDLENASADEKDRLSFFAEISWVVPIADQLTVVYEGVYDFDASDKYSDYIVAKLDFFDFQQSAFANLPGTFSLYYKYGELAPTFETGKEIGLGFSLKY